MAFTKLKLTTFGQTIEAKRHQGKGIKFTRVAIGDGLLGNGSMINRTELVSERHSMKIDGILTTDDGKQSVVVVRITASLTRDSLTGNWVSWPKIQTPRRRESISTTTQALSANIWTPRTTAL